MLAKKSSLKPKSSSGRNLYSACYVLLFLCFLIGSVLGSVFGKEILPSEISENSFLFSSGLGGNFALSILGFLWFHFFVLLMGFSIFGFWMIPFFAALRGYVLSCLASTIIVSFPGRGVIMALIIVAIPSIFSLPSFFVLSADSIVFSRRLFSLSRGNYSPLPKGAFRRSILCVPILLLGAIINFALVPYLIALIG